jgi:hypothetical protein
MHALRKQQSNRFMMPSSVRVRWPAGREGRPADVRGPVYARYPAASITGYISTAKAPK